MPPPPRGACVRETVRKLASGGVGAAPGSGRSPPAPPPRPLGLGWGGVGWTRAARRRGTSGAPGSEQRHPIGPTTCTVRERQRRVPCTFSYQHHRGTGRHAGRPSGRPSGASESPPFRCLFLGPLFCCVCMRAFVCVRARACVPEGGGGWPAPQSTRQPLEPSPTCTNHPLLLPVLCCAVRGVRHDERRFRSRWTACACCTLTRWTTWSRRACWPPCWRAPSSTSCASAWVR